MKLKSKFEFFNLLKNIMSEKVANKNLRQAKNNKKDEFYTQLLLIKEKE